jgi:hypothetical protein
MEPEREWCRVYTKVDCLGASAFLSAGKMWARASGLGAYAGR